MKILFMLDFWMILIFMLFWLVKKDVYILSGLMFKKIGIFMV